MKIAVTGGIGEGKSTVLSLLNELGQTTESADAIAAQVFASESINAKLAQIIGVQGPVEPKQLRLAIASNTGLRRQVHALMHEPVVDGLLRSPATFIEVPLLIETSLQPRFDEVWVIYATPLEQQRRLLERYGDLDHVRQILGTQMTTRAKLPFADRIIRTNQPISSVRRELELGLNALLA